MITRRESLFRLAGGVGGVALADLLESEGLLAADGLSKPGENHSLSMVAREPHFQPRPRQ